MSFEAISHFAETGGLIILFALCAGVAAYAFWPGNRNTFDRAARAPLDEDLNDGP
jgi:cytochrome c oxidase cbb3-type subunit IV